MTLNLINPFLSLKNHSMKRIGQIIIFCHITSATHIYANSDYGHGKVELNGEIVESACTIDMNSLDQTVDMGIIPISTLSRLGESKPKDFFITLIDCRWGESSKNNYQGFDVTFTGHTNDQFFLVEGEAEGIQLRLENSSGKQILPGMKVPFEEQTTETIINKYSFKLIPNGQELKPGLYSSLVHYSISYN